VTTMTDLGPAAQRVADLLATTRDEQLTAETPCPHYSVGDLIDHIDGIARAFREAATKKFPETGPRGPVGDASSLRSDWRTQIPDDLAQLAAAWRDPQAWTGMTKAGPVDVPGEIAGLVALNELVVHGWDLARATGQRFECDSATLTTCYELATQFADPQGPIGPDVPFGRPLDVGDDASALDRLIAITGREPAWTTA
jgi:uncharacterized protein (TIGR03086 family)